ncbi:MAG: DUF2812 domain-containing protein [Clostridium sp.]
MSELIKVTYALQKKEKLEAWLSDILQEGWELVSFRYVMLGALMNFRFVEGKKQHVKVCFYDVKYDVDEAIFLEENWKVLCRNGQSVIFYHENLNQPLPLLDMRLYTKRRFFKMSCNLLYLFSLLYCVREENEAIRQPWLYLSTLILFSLPLLFDIKSTRKYSNLIRILLNICYALIVSGFVYLLLELIISSFYKLF